MKTMILMMGASGSGKSTLARKIFGENDNSVILSTDDTVSAPWNIKSVVHSDVPAEKTIYLWHKDMIGLSHQLNQKKTAVACSIGINNVIIDNTNTSLMDVQPYLDIAKKFKYVVKVVEPNTEWCSNLYELEHHNIHKVPSVVINSQLSKIEQNKESILDAVKKQNLEMEAQ